MAYTKIRQTLRLALVLLIGFVSFGGFAAEPTMDLVVPNEQRPAHSTRQRRRLVISIADRKLALFEGKELRRMWDIAVGKPSTPSPLGTFMVANRVVNPTWYGRKQTVAPGPKNPVGSRWIGLSKKGYGIHGTNAPDSIGTAASLGCIRMHTDDVEELYELIAQGDEVELVAKPEGDLLAAFSPRRPSPVDNEKKPSEGASPVLVASAER